MHSDTMITGYIDAPPRSSVIDAAIVVTVVVVLSLALLMPGFQAISTRAVLAGLLALAIIRGAVYAVHIALLALLWLLLVSLVPLLQVWPLSIFVPLAAYGVVASIFPRLRHSVGWIHKGDIRWEIFKLMIVTVVVAILALLGWVILAKPDIEHYLSQVPPLPLWAYPFAGVGFAIFNAAMEEAIFRGIFLEALDSAIGTNYWSVCIQAIPFAALHYLAGFPNGVPGFFMVLVYGLMLGAIRRLSGGMLAPFVTHVAADITIFTILAFSLIQHPGGNTA